MLQSTHNTAVVQEVFTQINNANISYAMIDIHEESFAKEINVIVKKEDLTCIQKCLQQNEFRIIPHPLGSYYGWSFAYGANEYVKYLNTDDTVVNICNELCVKSLMSNMWIPLDESINARVWSHRYFDNDNLYWKLDDVTMFIYLCSSCVFDLGCFSKIYRERLNNLSNVLFNDETKNLFRLVFGTFTETLVLMIRDKDYDSILDSYVKFSDY